MAIGFAVDHANQRSYTSYLKLNELIWLPDASSAFTRNSNLLSICIDRTTIENGTIFLYMGADIALPFTKVNRILFDRHTWRKIPAPS
jgi:hypothetical protein